MNVYLGDKLSDWLREYARQRQISVSRAIRELIGRKLKSVRPQIMDGEHGKEVQEAQRTAKILRGLD